MPRNISAKAGIHPRLRLIGPWRRRVQCVTVLALLLIPFLRPAGIGLLRFDLAHGRLEIFGRLLLLEELSLLLLGTLAAVVLFLLLTLLLGRLWCGWICPQTTLSDLAEAIACRLGLHNSQGRLKGEQKRKWAFHGFCLFLAILVATNLVWYFLPPQEFLERLSEGSLGTSATLALCLIAAAVYLDLVFLRRLLCRDFCPYGRFQSALMDEATLTLDFDAERKEDCWKCIACLRSCPTGIDIREGLQMECIACGRCLDACRKVQAANNRPGLIRYRIGTTGRRAAALFNVRTLLLILVFAGLCIALTIGAMRRDTPGFTLSRATATPRILADGQVAVFYTAQFANRSKESLTLDLRATDAQGREISLRGPTNQVTLAAYERRRVDFALITPFGQGSPETVVFTLVDASGRRIGEIRTAFSLFEDYK